MKPTLARTEFAQALFERLARSRRRMPEPKIPWSDDWENLLEDAGIRNAEDGIEAARIASELTKGGWLKMKFCRNGERPRRVSIPLESERDWFGAFGMTYPADLLKNEPDFQKVLWVSELAFLRAARIGIPAHDCLRIQAFFENSGGQKPLVPIKERSLQIFGDEKRLDQLRNSALFDEGRLTLEMLRCFVASEPLAWERGPRPTRRIIVIENAATWHSYARWNRVHAAFGAVVYGCGNRFMDSIDHLAGISQDIGGSAQVYYFGDLDPQGLRIPRVASSRAVRIGLPPVEPHIWSYQQLFALGRGKEGTQEERLEIHPADIHWLGELADQAANLFSMGKRLPQEHVGSEFLDRCSVVE